MYVGEREVLYLHSFYPRGKEQGQCREGRKGEGMKATERQRGREERREREKSSKELEAKSEK